EAARGAAQPMLAPVDGFGACVVIRHRAGIGSEVLLERREAALRLFPRRRVRRRVVVADLESQALEPLDPRPIFGLGTRLAAVRRTADPANRPHTLRGAHAEIGEQLVDRTAGLECLRVGIVEHREREATAPWPVDRHRRTIGRTAVSRWLASAAFRQRTDCMPAMYRATLTSVVTFNRQNAYGTPSRRAK